MKSNFSSALLIIAILIVILTGCSGSNDTPEPQQEITFMANAGDQSVTDAWNRVIEQFESKHPGTHINLVFQKGAYLQQLQQLADDGKFPDVVQGSTSIFSHFNDEGLIMDLRLLADLKQYDLDDHFDQSVLDFSSVIGKLLSIPTYIVTPKLLYNKAYFQKSGIPEPSADMTWEEFAEICKEIKQRAAAGNSYGVLFPLQLNLLSALALSNGGSLSPDGQAFQGYTDGDKSVEAVRWYAKLAKDGLINTDTVPDSAHLLALGTAAMYVAYSVPQQTDGDRIGAVPFPGFAQSARALNSLNGGIAISEKTKNPNLSWEFMEFIAVDKTEGTTELAKVQGIWGTSDSLVESEQDDASFQADKKSYAYVKKDLFDLNANVWNISFAPINTALRQLMIAGDDTFKDEMTALARLLESTFKTPAD